MNWSWNPAHVERIVRSTCEAAHVRASWSEDPGWLAVDRQDARTLREAALFWVPSAATDVLVDKASCIRSVREEAPRPTGLVMFQDPPAVWETPSGNGLVLIDGTESSSPIPIDAITWDLTSASKNRLDLVTLCRPDRFPSPLLPHQGNGLVPFGRIDTTIPGDLHRATVMTLEGVDDGQSKEILALRVVAAFWRLLRNSTLVARRRDRNGINVVEVSEVSRVSSWKSWLTKGN